MFPSETASRSDPNGREGIRHFHFNSEIHVVTEGQYTLHTEEKSHLLRKGDVCIIPKGVSHGSVSSGEGCVRLDLILSLSRRRTKQSRIPPSKEFSVWNGLGKIRIFSRREEISSLADRFLAEKKKNDPISRLRKESLLTLIFLEITELLQKKGGPPTQNSFPAPYDGSFLDEELERFLMLEYRRKLSREETARHMGISAVQLSRIIKKDFGMNYTGLITALRMADAQKMLREGLSAAEIAKSVGYTTYNGFAAAFRRHFGTTPEKMRRQMAADQKTNEKKESNL